MTAVVICLGNPDRGDDGLGPAVARSLRALPGLGAEVIEARDPAGLLDLWAGADAAVVVDAVRGGGAPGQLVRLDSRAARGKARLCHSSHALDLAAVLRLAAVLGRLPRQLSVLGVEAASFAHGVPLSPAVAGAVPHAVRAVLEELSRASGSTLRQVP